MSEITPTGGSAFWAARGVRIVPEPVEEEFDEGFEDGGEGEEQGDGSAVEAPAGAAPASAIDAEPREEGEDGGETDRPAGATPAPETAPGSDAAPTIPTQSGPGAQVKPEPRPESPTDTAPETASDAQVSSGGGDRTEPDDLANAVPTAPAQSEPTTPTAEPEALTSPDTAAAPSPQSRPDSTEAPFIPTQATFDEVEPQLGEPVDGLAALNETLIDAARARAEREAKAAEPVWQLTDDNLAALPDLRTCLEAILLVVDEPVTEVVLAQIVERPTEQVAAALRALSAEYTSQGRGFDLREVGIGDGSLVTQTGWRFYTRTECAPVVERYIRDGQQSKLTQAALETLAVVAYRQPVSRSKVSAIRGVNCDGVMRTLLARGLVEECGTEYETGALLYRTTGYFLERMGLKGLEELPDLAPLLPSAADMEDEV